jgi:hypothetical protein
MIMKKYEDDVDDLVLLLMEEVVDLLFCCYKKEFLINDKNTGGNKILPFLFFQ